MTQITETAKTRTLLIALTVLDLACARELMAQVPIAPSRFATDTLFPAVGGPFKIEQRYGPVPQGPNGLSILAATRTTDSDTTTTFYQRPTEPVLAHEAGHILDMRRLAPEIFGAAAQGWERYPRNDWLKRQPNPDEYVAEAFARALLSGRKGFTDSTKVAREMPGAIEFIRWLRTRSPFAKPGR